MPVITFEPNTVCVDVPEGSSLLEAARNAGVNVEAPCGGMGICGKCLVRILSGGVDFANRGSLPQEMLDEGWVLLCKTSVRAQPVRVQVASGIAKEQGKFSETTADFLAIDQSLLPQKSELEPIVKALILTVSPPRMGDGLADTDRLVLAVKDALPDAGTVLLSLGVVRRLPEAVRQEDGYLRVWYRMEGGAVHLVDVASGSDSTPNYGLAVDIGTTTVAAQLVKVDTGEILAAKTDYNGQISCGLDIISRIGYAQTPARLEELRQKILDTINSLTGYLCSACSVDAGRIYSIALSANTTMVHLLLGVVPENIRLEPYTPAIYKVPLWRAAEVGISICPEAPVLISPSVGSYVGGDITAGILCTQLAADSEDLCLFIDIGTNGEIVLGNSEFLLGCACSAGPAFEGGGMKHGMRASAGAIERVKIDPETGVAKYWTIGDVPAAGICGSGVISVAAELFRTGYLDPAGKLRLRESPSIHMEGRNAHYTIAPAQESADGTAITISETDLDNLIRAKGAIFSACSVLLQNIGMEFSDLSRVYIAGGFGRYLDIQNAQTIGLIPNLPKERYHFIGNSSILGSYMCLVSARHRALQQELAQKITYLDLSVEPTYMDQYMAALFLPHTDGSLFL